MCAHGKGSDEFLNPIKSFIALFALLEAAVAPRRDIFTDCTIYFALIAIMNCKIPPDSPIICVDCLFV